jgi:hypothetical protein
MKHFSFVWFSFAYETQKLGCIFIKFHQQFLVSHNVAYVGKFQPGNSFLKRPEFFLQNETKHSQRNESNFAGSHKAKSTLLTVECL